MPAPSDQQPALAERQFERSVEDILISSGSVQAALSAAGVPFKAIYDDIF